MIVEYCKPMVEKVNEFVKEMGGPDRVERVRLTDEEWEQFVREEDMALHGGGWHPKSVCDSSVWVGPMKGSKYHKRFSE